MPNNGVDKGGVTTSNNQIININQEIEERITEGVNKEGRVSMRCDKVERKKKGVELLVPIMQSLFETINSLV